MTTTDIAQEEPGLHKAVLAMAQDADAAALDGGLSPGFVELLKVRVSQLNGCAFCLDMHWKDARARGESEERMYSLAAWHEARCYDDRYGRSGSAPVTSARRIATVASRSSGWTVSNAVCV